MLALQEKTYLLYGIINDIKVYKYKDARKKLMEFMEALEKYPKFIDLKPHPVEVDERELAGIILANYLYLCENYSDELMEKIIRQAKSLDCKLYRLAYDVQTDDLKSITKAMVEALTFVSRYSEYPFEVEFDEENNRFIIWTLDSDEIRHEDTFRLETRTMEEPELTAKEATRLILDSAFEAIKREVTYLL